MVRTSAAAASPWPTPEERAREREQKREAVLSTAVRLFNSKGFHATSLDDVALALNVTKPTIYHYFANKDEVLFECVRRGLELLPRHWSISRNSNTSLLEHVLVVVQHQWMYVERNSIPLTIVLATLPDRLWKLSCQVRSTQDS